MPYCRTAIEKYLYSKLNDYVFAMYAFKNKKEDELFAQKRQELIKGYTKVFGQQNVCKEMMEELGVKTQFQLSKIAKAEDTKNNFSTLASPHTVNAKDFMQVNPYQ